MNAYIQSTVATGCCEAEKLLLDLKKKIMGRHSRKWRVSKQNK
jgi:hypothetical protein